jgi:hypothetical protein
VAVAGGGEAKIKKDEALTLQATIDPPDATVQGVNWTADGSDIVAVRPSKEAPDKGVVTRLPQAAAGGTAIVRAISKSGEKCSVAMKIDVLPKPTAITIEQPGNAFLGKSLKLKAEVTPPEASQDVAWSIQGSYNKNNIHLRRDDGELTVEEPTVRGGSASGQLRVRATSKANPEKFAEVTVSYGGFAVKTISIRSPRTVELKTDMEISATVTPGNAAQEVEWSLDGGNLATIKGPTRGRTVTIVATKKGRIDLRATATDGSGVTATASFGDAVPVKGLTIEPQKIVLDIGQTVTLTPKFDPAEAKAAVSWSVSDPAVARVDAKGKVIPLKAGTAKVTAAISDPSLSASVDLEIKLADTSAVSIDQFEILRQLIEKYATAIGILDNPSAAKHYGKYIYALRQDASHGGREPKPGTSGGRTPVDLATVRRELIDLRDKFYMLEHREWLVRAGFSEKNNCLLRDEGKITVDAWTFNGHVTMFDTGQLLPIGSDPDALIRAVYRIKSQEGASLHVTLYVNDNRDTPARAYISGWDWKPPFADREAWLGQSPSFDFFKIRPLLLAWLHANMGPANQALTGLYNEIKKNDGNSIGKV